ncbi:RDD family protein, partial [Cronobacter sakazakii]
MGSAFLPPQNPRWGGEGQAPPPIVRENAGGPPPPPPPKHP